MSYFKPETDPKIDFEKVDKNSLAMLETARGLAGVPFIVTSHYRTEEHSLAVGGFKGDAHTKVPCTAFDIACAYSSDRFKMVQALLKAGFNRIGFNSKHIHVDCDLSKPPNVMWLE